MDSIFLDNERHLRVPVAEARACIVRFLRSHEFTITTEQVTMLGAKRGSQIAGSVQPKKLPITFRATILHEGTGCVAQIHIGDAWRSGVGKVWGMNSPYTTVINEVQAQLDQALQPLAAGDEGFAGSSVTTTTRSIPLVSQANTGIVKGGGAVADKVDDLVTPGSVHSTPKALKEVVLRSSKGVASFDRISVEGLMTVGLLVSTRPGSMPANLTSDVEALSAKIESEIARMPAGQIICDLSDADIPVAEFLGRQAAIRQDLPLRTLHVCTTCKFEKIVNPDYQVLQEKNRRKRVITGAVGATVTSAGISPFLLVGSLIKLKNFDIPFVCPRCQGLDAESSIVTYCPNCGERRDEAVLRSCRRCKHNFGAAHDRAHGEFWRPEPEQLTVPFLPAQTMAPPAFTAPVSPAPSFTPPTIMAPRVAAPVLVAPVVAAPVLTVKAPTQWQSGPSVSPPSAPSAVVRPAGWYDDTTRRHQHRYWDGAQWTAHAADGGVAAHDPI